MHVADDTSQSCRACHNFFMQNSGLPCEANLSCTELHFYMASSLQFMTNKDIIRRSSILPLYFLKFQLELYRNRTVIVNISGRIF